MRIKLRRKQRWFHAVAITCLSGFALCGCARGTRDLSSNLQKSAEQEAIEAERHVAERKRQDSNSKTSKILKEQDFEEDSVAQSRTGRPDDPWADTSTQGVANSEESDSQADVEEDVIRTVSGSESVDELLSDSEAEPVEELFADPPDDVSMNVAESASESSDDEGMVRIQRKPTPPSQPSTTQRSRSANTLATARSGQASYRGAQEHPWARKSPVIERTPAEESQFAADSETESPVESPRNRESSASRDRQLADHSAAGPSQIEESDSQAETKARIRVLVDQANSLLKKGEYRSAYRAAQVAQRMAESADIYFSAGEEQPADVVRAVLSKIRTNDTQIASGSKRPAPTSQSTAKKAHPFDDETMKAFQASKLPDGWASAGWRDGAEEKPAEKPVAVKETPTKPKEVAAMRIQPGSRRRESRAFPGRNEWQSASENTVAQSSATAADNSAAELIPATISQEAASIRPEAKPSRATGQLLVPRPFPKPDFDAEPTTSEASSDELALTQDWRSEKLDTAASGRMPLLVAPLPPQDSGIEPDLDLADEPLAVEADDLTKPASESKLWMLLAAAAGAFAMLFVRRRPAPVRAETKAS